MNDGPILKSMEEAEALRQTLVDDLMKVQLELSNKDVRGENGSRVNGIVYHQWRQRKLVEQHELTSRLRYVKGWIRVHAHQPGEKPKPPKSRIAALELLYRRMKSYAEYTDGKGNGNWDPDEADQRWNHIMTAMEEVEKAADIPEEQ